MRISGHQLFWGLLLIVLGSLLLLSNLGIISQSIWDFWPVIIIIIGLKIIIHSYVRQRSVIQSCVNCGEHNHE